MPSRACRRKGAQGVLEKLLTLHGSRISVDRLSAETLRLILESFGVTRGALMIYEPRRQSLLLAAEMGLGTIGKERLRRVTRKDPRSWDMPLHGLLNERAYLIDAPADNRYVPPLLDEGNHALARVACVPIYRQRSPVGAFVLLAESGQGLTETEIRLAHVPLRYVGAILDEAIQRHGLQAFTNPDGGSERKTRPRLRPCVTDPREGAAVGGPKSSADGDTDSAEILLTEIAEPENNGSTDAAYAAVQGTRAVLEDRDRAQRAEIRRLQGELAAAVTEIERRVANCDREHERQIVSVAAERDALAAEVAELTRIIAAKEVEAEAHEKASFRLREVETERDALGANVKELSRALAAKEAEAETYEEDRARLHQLEAEFDTVRQNAARTAVSLEAALSEIEARQQRISRLEEDRRRLKANAVSGRAEIEAETNAEIVRLREAEALARRMNDDLRAQNANLGRRAGVLEQSLAVSAARIAAAMGREDAARDNSARWRYETERSQESLHELARAMERSAERIVELEKEAGQIHHERTEWLRQKDSLEEKRIALEQRAGALEARASELEATELTARNDREELRRRLERRESQSATLEHALESATAEAAALEAREVAARRESETWRTEAARRAEAITTLERRIDDATCETKRVGERLEAARHERECARREVKTLTERLSALESRLEAALADAARLAHDEEASTGEAARWQRAAGELTERIAAMEDRVRRHNVERAALEERARSLEADLARRDEHGRDSASTMKRLASEHRAARAEAARLSLQAEASESRLREIENEREEQARHVASLEAAIARLETERAIRMRLRSDSSETPKPGVSPAVSSGVTGRSGGGAAGSGVPRTHGAGAGKAAGVGAPRAHDSKRVAGQRLVIIEPAAAVGRTLTQALGTQAQWIEPAGDTAVVMEAVCRADPTIVGINLGTRGPANGFAIFQALTRAGISEKARVWAYVAPEQATRAIALGPIECSPPPVESSRLVELLESYAEKGTRALTVGLEMNGLIALRERLTQMGVSLSMAWDSKQGQELLDMVRPNVVIVNLDLGRGDGYRTLGRLAGMKPRHTWILCGGATPPAEAGSLVVTGATQSVSGAFLALPDVAAALLTDLDGTGSTPATKASASRRVDDRGAVGSTKGSRPAPSGSSRTPTSSGRRDVASGTHRW